MGVTVNVEVTLEEGMVIARALQQWRRIQLFSARALHSTDEERERAKGELAVLDRLLGKLA